MALEIANNPPTEGKSHDLPKLVGHERIAVRSVKVLLHDSIALVNVAHAYIFIVFHNGAPPLGGGTIGVQNPLGDRTSTVQSENFNPDWGLNVGVPNRFTPQSWFTI